MAGSLGRALLVGCAVGIVGGGFRAAIEWIGALRGRLQSTSLPPALGAFLVGAAMVGLAVKLVRRFPPEAGGSGVQEIEGALALGSGLALGGEGPTIQMGGALSRMVADVLRVDAEAAHRMIAAGAGAGLVAAFNSPLSGVLFVIEEMRGQFHYGVLSVQEVLIACVTADAVVRLLLGDAPAVPMPSYEIPVHALALFLVFGLLVGGLGGWLLLAWPDAMGGGYATIANALGGGIPAAGLLGLVAVRLGTTAMSYATGAPGGNFAPTVGLGALLGLWFGHVFSGAIPDVQASPGVFAVAGMAALFASTVRAPITGIALAAELTGEFALILPIAVSTIGATLAVHALGGRPIYAVLLERTLSASAAPRSAPR